MRLVISMTRCMMITRIGRVFLFYCNSTIPKNIYMQLHTVIVQSKENRKFHETVILQLHLHLFCCRFCMRYEWERTRKSDDVREHGHEHKCANAMCPRAIATQAVINNSSMIYNRQEIVYYPFIIVHPFPCLWALTHTHTHTHTLTHTHMLALYAINVVVIRYNSHTLYLLHIWKL